MVEQLYILPILLFSVVIHEVAHGYMALKLGDPTAKMLGRLTLNPLPHIDPIGSIFIPLFSLLTAGGVFIAWAKPVPVDPTNFLRPRRDDFLVSIVGPTSNLLVAFVCSVAVILLGFVGATVNTAGSALAIDGLEFLTKMFYGGIYLNIVLAVFNLIPVPYPGATTRRLPRARSVSSGPSCTGVSQCWLCWYSAHHLLDARAGRERDVPCRY